jgi:hypothetical protein
VPAAGTELPNSDFFVPSPKSAFAASLFAVVQPASFPSAPRSPVDGDEACVSAIVFNVCALPFTQA